MSETRIGFIVSSVVNVSFCQIFSSMARKIAFLLYSHNKTAFEETKTFPTCSNSFAFVTSLVHVLVNSDTLQFHYCVGP